MNFMILKHVSCHTCPKHYLLVAFHLSHVHCVTSHMQSMSNKALPKYHIFLNNTLYALFLEWSFPIYLRNCLWGHLPTLCRFGTYLWKFWHWNFSRKSFYACSENIYILMFPEQKLRICTRSDTTSSQIKGIDTNIWMYDVPSALLKGHLTSIAQ